MDTDTYNQIIEYLINHTFPQDWTSERRRRLRQQANHYIVQENILFKRDKGNEPVRVILKDDVTKILYNMHSTPNAGHFGVKTTIDKTRRRYFWPTMNADIKSYIETCDACQRQGKPARTEELRPIKVGNAFDRIGIDVVGPLKLTSTMKRYIIVATDYFTKWPEARAVEKADSITVAWFLYDEIICRHGCPKEILSDRGTVFLSQVVANLVNIMGAHHRLASAYHPQSNGLTERFNQTLCRALDKCMSETKYDWDVLIPPALFAYRTIKNRTTKYEPFYLLYGQDPTLPIELDVVTWPAAEINENQYEDLVNRRISEIVGEFADNKIKASRNIKDAQARQKRLHDNRVRAMTYKTDDMVLEYRSDLQNVHGDKFRNRWTGPFFIHRVLGNGSYVLRTIRGEILNNRPVHGNRLKPYKQRDFIAREMTGTIGIAQ
jgi:transposase InsO family protein